MPERGDLGLKKYWIGGDEFERLAVRKTRHMIFLTIKVRTHLHSIYIS